VTRVIGSLSGDEAAFNIPRKPILNRLKAATRKKKLAIAAFLAFAAALFIGISRIIRVEVPSPKVPEGSMLLLTNIANASRDSELESVTTLVRSQLSQSAYMNLLDESSIHETLRRMSRTDVAISDPKVARELAMRNGVPLVIFGTVSRADQAYRLDLDLQKVGSEPERPKASWKFSESAPSKKQFFDI